MANRTTKPKTTDTETTVVEEIVSKKPKTYEKDDLIVCESIMPGELIMIGKKTRILYRWMGAGDKVEVEYQDLVAAKITHSKFVYAPLFIIEDEDLVANWKDVANVYENMYTHGDLEEILTLTPSQIKSAVKQLPEGAKSALKTLAATNIQNGKLDSIKRVAALDEVFGTNLLTEVELFG